MWFAKKRRHFPSTTCVAIAEKKYVPGVLFGEGYSGGTPAENVEVKEHFLMVASSTSGIGVFFFEPQRELLEKQLDGFLSHDVFDKTSFDGSFLSAGSTIHECQSRYQDYQLCNISVSVWVDTVSNENAPTSEDIHTGLRSTWETSDGFRLDWLSTILTDSMMA